MGKYNRAQGSGLNAQGGEALAPSPEFRTQRKTADFLLEIGTEELPAAYLPGLIEQLKTEARLLFEENHLSFQSIESFGAPRRLVLFVRRLAAVRQKPSEEVRGPSKQAAFDASGKPTPALDGFLRSHNATVSQTRIAQTPKGDYVYVAKPATNTPTARLLPIWASQIVGRLRSPKMMRWDGSGVRFARPIRWLLARYGKSPLRVAYGALVSQSRTRVGRPQQLRYAAIGSIESYFAALKRAGILLDPQERRRTIERTVSQEAKAFRGAIAPEMIHYGLLEEVTHLVERPLPLIGEFDRKYLELPREVLLASMAKHQRVFAIESAGKLLPRCIAVLEGQAKKPADVRAVVERILNARLADSLLFWKQDQERSLPFMASALSGVTFHERIGNMEEKSKRLDTLGAVLVKLWNLSEDEGNNLHRAAQLAKADLVSTMVKEFPTLQGIMGKHYALVAGESEDVAIAIEEHYLPLAGKMPKSIVGSGLSILDKYDTLASYFNIDIFPTGDQDPFGLRRAAQGIVEVAWAVKRPLPLETLFLKWQTLVPATRGKSKLQQQIQSYLLERLYTFEWPKPQPTVDCIDAVIELYRDKSCEDLVDVMQRIQTLSALRDDASLLKAAKVIERTRNILRSAKAFDGPVEPALLKEAPEQALWEAYTTSRDRVGELINRRSYDKATAVFGEAFYEPLHVFFDKVMVNVPEEGLRRNRLALMRAIQTLYTDRVADLSKLTLLQQHRS